MIRELRTAEGGFASALDADSEGVEGKFYAWTPAELVEVLGQVDGGWAADVFEVTDGGHLRARRVDAAAAPRPRGPGRRAAARRTTPAAGRPRRAGPAGARRQGGRGLERAGDQRALRRRAAARRPAVRRGGARRRRAALAELHLVSDGRLLRVSRDGVAGRHAGVLEDYGCVAAGFLSLVQATGDAVWLDRARGRSSTARSSASRAEDGGFYDTADDAEALVARPRDPGDNASPCGLSAMVHALVDRARADR